MTDSNPERDQVKDFHCVNESSIVKRLLRVMSLISTIFKKSAKCCDRCREENCAQKDKKHSNCVASCRDPPLFNNACIHNVTFDNTYIIVDITMTSLRAAWPAHEHVRMSGRHRIKSDKAQAGSRFQAGRRQMSPCRPAHEPVPAATRARAGRHSSPNPPLPAGT